MSARDAESGSSTYKGGSGSAGGMGNAGLGGGSGAGGQGGGYGGGMTRNTGMSTGKDWYGNTAFGAPGGRATGYATRDAKSLGRAGMGPTMGQYGGFKTMSGKPMFGGSPVQGQSFKGMGAGQAFGRAKQAYDAWKNSQIEQGPLNRPTINRPAPNRPTPAVVSPVTPPSYPAYEAEMALPEYPPVPEIDIPFDEPAPTRTLSPGGWPGQNTHFGPGQNGKIFTDRVPQGETGTRSIDTTEGGFPSLKSVDTRPAGLYASGGLVRSAMLTAKGVSNGMKGALVVNQKGNVVSGKLKSGPIVQVGTGGNVMKRGTVKITWGS